MRTYQAEIKYKKNEPYYDFKFEAVNDTEALLLAKRYEKDRIGIERFNDVFKSMTVRVSA